MSPTAPPRCRRCVEVIARVGAVERAERRVREEHARAQPREEPVARGPDDPERLDAVGMLRARRGRRPSALADGYTFGASTGDTPSGRHEAAPQLDLEAVAAPPGPTPSAGSCAPRRPVKTTSGVLLGAHVDSAGGGVVGAASAEAADRSRSGSRRRRWWWRGRGWGRRRRRRSRRPRRRIDALGLHADAVPLAVGVLRAPGRRSRRGRRRRRLGLRASDTGDEQPRRTRQEDQDGAWQGRAA